MVSAEEPQVVGGDVVRFSTGYLRTVRLYSAGFAVVGLILAATPEIKSLRIAEALPDEIWRVFGAIGFLILARTLWLARGGIGGGAAIRVVGGDLLIGRLLGSGLPRSIAIASIQSVQVAPGSLTMVLEEGASVTLRTQWMDKGDLSRFLGRREW